MQSVVSTMLARSCSLAARRLTAGSKISSSSRACIAALSPEASLLRACVPDANTSMSSRSPSCVRTYSSTVSLSSAASAELSDILTRELAEEEATDSTIPPSDLVELQSQLEDAGWRIVDDAAVGSSSTGSSGATVKLFRSEPIEGSGAKVAIAFHCQDTLTNEDEDGGVGLFGTDANDDEEEEAAVDVRFTCLVSRAGKAMVYTCVSSEATVNVERVCMVEEDDVETLIRDGIPEKAYQGPEFAELAEDLQTSLCAYVDEVCGVDSDVAAFISMYADYKEQLEYVRWLKNVKSML